MRAAKLGYWFLVGVAFMLLIAPWVAQAAPGKGKGYGHGHDEGSGDSVSAAIAGAAAGATATSGASSEAVSSSVSSSTGGDGGAGGSASATGGEGGTAEANVTNNVSLFGGSGGASSLSGDGGGSNILSQTNINNPDDIKIRNVPDARAPYANATAPCRIALSAGVSFVGAGASAGASVEDKECTLRQTAQTFSNMGVPGMGLWLMCRSRAVQRAFANDPPEDADIDMTIANRCDAMIIQLQELAVIETGYETVGDDSGK